MIFIWIIVLMVPARWAGRQVEWDHGNKSRTEYITEVANIKEVINRNPAGADVFIEKNGFAILKLHLIMGQNFQIWQRCLLLLFRKILLTGKGCSLLNGTVMLPAYS